MEWNITGKRNLRTFVFSQNKIEFIHERTGGAPAAVRQQSTRISRSYSCIVSSGEWRVASDMGGVSDRGPNREGRTESNADGSTNGERKRGRSGIRSNRRSE